MSKTLTLDVPEELAELLPEEEASQVARQAWVLRVVRQGKLGAGRGAELLDMHLTDFVKLMTEHGVAYFDYTAEDWAAEEREVQGYLGDHESDRGSA